MKPPEGQAVTDISADQALAAAAEAVAIVAAKKEQADRNGGNPTTDAQLAALLKATAVIACDTREET